MMYSIDESPLCTKCEHTADFSGNYVECVLLHRFVDWYYWKCLSPEDCPLRRKGDGDD